MLTVLSLLFAALSFITLKLLLSKITATGHLKKSDSFITAFRKFIQINKLTNPKPGTKSFWRLFHSLYSPHNIGVSGIKE